MKKIGTIILMLISINLIGQNLVECGIDNNPKLIQTESEFLNEYMNDVQKKDIDFTGKTVLFITGNSAKTIGTKSKYFEHIKEWNKEGNKIATWVVELNDEQNEKINSAGYDLIVTYWVKILTERRKRIIINEIKPAGNTVYN